MIIGIYDHSINKEVYLELQLSIVHSLFLSYIVLFYNMSFEGNCCVSNDIGIYFCVFFGIRIIILLYFLFVV